ncbi:MAG: aminopeptidase [Ruminococcaceae bacterium]|nr:aminopeptidase [Oscillospiraceae bacterium]
MKEELSKAELLQKEIMNKKDAYLENLNIRLEEGRSYCDDYMAFLDLAKTEREFVKETVKLLESNGFSRYDNSEKIGKGVYYNNRGKSIIAVVKGSRPLSDGFRMIAAHIDSPRLDLKPNPMYESDSLGYFKTHYYGGIKKYQWAAIPLAMHGTIITHDGNSVDIVIGEDDQDEVFCVTDLLPHLSGKAQDSRTAREVIKGEELNILIGSVPVDDEKIKEPIKLNLMSILNEKYGMIEKDFVSAEIEFVPAFKSKYIGFDKSLIGAYAQDDRVCAYAALKAFLNTEMPEYWTMLVLADKEETGSDGNTGLASSMIFEFVTSISEKENVDRRIVFMNSDCISSDVAAGYDPTFSSVSDPQNSSYLGRGISVERYTGAAGKVYTSEASAEYVWRIVKMLDDAGIVWQSGELGKVDEGGGGTVAKFIARLGADVIDMGVPVLSMHSPFEVTSCLDVYELYKAFRAFYK